MDENARPVGGPPVLLGPFPEAARLRLALAARGHPPPLETADPVAAALRLRETPAVGLLVARTDAGPAGAGALVRALRHDRAAAGRQARALVLGPGFTRAELAALRDAGVTMAALWPAPDERLARVLAALGADRRAWIDSPGYCGPSRRTARDPFRRFAGRRAKDYSR